MMAQTSSWGLNKEQGIYSETGRPVPCPPATLSQGPVPGCAGSISFPAAHPDCVLRCLQSGTQEPLSVLTPAV